MFKRWPVSLALVGLAIAAGAALAEKRYGPGVSDTEIKIGNTNPYSGPASAYGVVGKSIAAYFAMVNEQGGVNGRKIASSAETTAIARRRPLKWCAS